MRTTASTLALLAALGAAAAPALAATPADLAAKTPPVRTAASALGSLGAYRSIAADTLAIVDRGDIPAARTRIKDLETRWDADEAALKPKDKAAWTTLDKAIDNALTALRSPMPKSADCAAALKSLLAQMDAVNAA